MSEFSVAAGLARGLMGFAVSKGASRKALSERSGIDAMDLQDQDNRIPFAKYVALMRAGKALSNDPAFALHFGETIDLSDMSIVGLIGRASTTLMDAFVQLNRFRGLVIEVDLEIGVRFELLPGDGGIWLVDTRRNPNDFPELTESTFARMLCGSGRMISDSGWTGDAPLAKALRFTHPDPGYRAEYERIFRAPVLFESDKNAVLIDAMWASYRLALQPRYVFGILSAQAEALLQRLKNSKTVRGRVESLLLPILHTGEVGMDAIADRLGVSRWTLSRRLKAENVTFEQLLDQLRHKMALHYLSGKKTSVNETAYLVGFSEPAAFSRAFKRWTGRTPRTARAPKG